MKLTIFLYRAQADPKTELEPRSLSIRQFRGLFSECQDASKLQKDFDKFWDTSHIQDLRLDDLEEKRKAMVKEMHKIVEDRNRMLEETNQFINTVKKDNENRHKRVQELIKDNTDKIKELQKFREESEAFEESVVK